MTVDPPATPATNPDEFHVEEIPPPPPVILGKLRRQFPNWAFLHDPQTGMWTALRGDEKTGVTIRGSSALDLKTALQELPWWQQ